MFELIKFYEENKECLHGMLRECDDENETQLRVIAHLGNIEEELDALILSQEGKL